MLCVHKVNSFNRCKHCKIRAGNLNIEIDSTSLKFNRYLPDTLIGDSFPRFPHGQARLEFYFDYPVTV